MRRRSSTACDGVVAGVLVAVLAVVLLAVDAGVTEPTPAAAAPRPTCERQGEENTSLDGLVGRAQPVILVHGWTGEPMQDSRTALHRKPSKSKRQYLLFDYRRANTVWASDPRIAACLAAYIDQVSKTHQSRGGNGRVFLVAHSMGGLAIRFALDPKYGGVEGLMGRVGGVTTIDTPHTGSTWGASWVAAMLSAKKRIEQGQMIPATVKEVLPDVGSQAWVCLKGGPLAKWVGCDVPPPMPAVIQLQQVVGQVSVRRTLFGREAYTMNLGGDGIVPAASQWGGGSGFVQVPCTVDAMDLLSLNPFGPVGFMLADNVTLDIFNGAMSANSRAPLVALEPILAGLMGAACSHSAMATAARSMTAVDEALADQAAYTGLSTIGSLRTRAPVPASCRHQPAVARQGKVSFGVNADGASRGEGQLALGGVDGDPAPAFGDVTGDGLSEAVVTYTCGAGGVSWPNLVLVYGPGAELVASYDFIDSPSVQEHADVTEMDVVDGGIDVSWVSYEGASGNPRYYSGRLELVDGDLELSDVSPKVPDVEVGPGFVGPLRVGESATELVEQGLIEASDDDMCDVRWESAWRRGEVWTEFRDGESRDDLDSVAVVEQIQGTTGDVITTAEGVGLGTSTTTLQEVYGDELTFEHFVGEGEYDAYVLFGEGGALMFALSDNEDTPMELRTVAGMYAVAGTSMADLAPMVGGC